MKFMAGKWRRRTMMDYPCWTQLQAREKLRNSLNRKWYVSKVKGLRLKTESAGLIMKGVKTLVLRCCKSLFPGEKKAKLAKFSHELTLSLQHKNEEMMNFNFKVRKVISNFCCSFSPEKYETTFNEKSK